ncbi:MAG: GNAT family N-acetyltransferase [Rhodobacteraceae bacterium]|nr:GNAT family N-acetyltransferase [Paracoccaceae bacterium]
MQAPTLHTPRLTLRPLTAEDFPAVRAFYASERSRFVGGPKNAVQAWRHFAMEIGHWALKGYGRWGVEVTETGEFAGIIGIFGPEGYPEPELAWDLMEGFDGKGYATEAARAARDWAYTKAHMPALMSLVDPDNIASRKVAERLGAVKEGHFDHEIVGLTEIWRHPSPEALAAEGAA